MHILLYLLFIDRLHSSKEAKFDLAGTQLKVAVANGLGNARALIDAVRSGKAEYDFVEIMACPGGCVGGGGQPFRDGQELASERAKKLYGLDKVNNLRPLTSLNASGCGFSPVTR